jgi:hypothetical protein
LGTATAVVRTPSLSKPVAEVLEVHSPPLWSRVRSGWKRFARVYRSASIGINWVCRNISVLDRRGLRRWWFRVDFNTSVYRKCRFIRIF